MHDHADPYADFVFALQRPASSPGCRDNDSEFLLRCRGETLCAFVSALRQGRDCCKPTAVRQRSPASGPPRGLVYQTTTPRCLEASRRCENADGSSRFGGIRSCRRGCNRTSPESSGLLCRSPSSSPRLEVAVCSLSARAAAGFERGSMIRATITAMIKFHCAEGREVCGRCCQVSRALPCRLSGNFAAASGFRRPCHCSVASSPTVCQDGAPGRRGRHRQRRTLPEPATPVRAPSTCSLLFSFLRQVILGTIYAGGQAGQVCHIVFGHKAPGKIGVFGHFLR